VRLIEEAFPDDPAHSEALLHAVAARDAPATARLYVPRATVAFGRLDRLNDGFEAATNAARERGFAPVVRSVGGRAAAYTDHAVVYEEITPQDGLAVDVEARFEAFSGRVAGALRALGADARVGELPGEYCPGRFTVSAGGLKLAGVAQRVVKDAALVSAAIVVSDGARVRDVLVAVYDALGIGWDPATAGALDDVVPGVTVSDLLGALRRRPSSSGAPRRTAPPRRA
jgi:octanoyl-[GcvH]:protein N-octanoyltransferase